MGIRPTQLAIATVREMAIDAAKNDEWLEPLPDEHIGSDDPIQAHREAWQETDHFRTHYGDRISDIVDVDEVNFDLGTYDRFYDLYCPLLDLFWDTWEEAVGFYEKGATS